MLKSLLRKDLNLRKFKTSAFLVKHMTPLTLFLLTWMSIDCRKFARKLYFAKKNDLLGKIILLPLYASILQKTFHFCFSKIPNSYFMFLTWIDDAKNKLPKFIFFFLLSEIIWIIIFRPEQADKVCEWYFCFSNFTLFQQKTPFLFSFVEKLGKHI